MVSDREKADDDTVTVTVRLPSDLVARIDDEAQQETRTRSNLIRKKLEESTPKKKQPEEEAARRQEVG